MYTALQDFLSEWREESEKTLTIFEAIDEDSKSLKEYDNLRSLERFGMAYYSESHRNAF